MVLRRKSVGEQDVADQQGTFCYVEAEDLPTSRSSAFLFWLHERSIMMTIPMEPFADSVIPKRLLGS